MNPETRVAYDGGNLSTIFDRLHPAYRRGLDRAIIERDPPALADVYGCFHCRSNGISRSAFYRYAARLRARAAVQESIEIARAAGRDPADELGAILDAEFLRIFAANREPADPKDYDIPANEDDISDPYVVSDAAFERLQRILLMRQRLAASRLMVEQAARCKIDAVRQRGDAHVIKLTQAVLHAASPPQTAALPCPAPSPERKSNPTLNPSAPENPHSEGHDSNSSGGSQ